MKLAEGALVLRGFVEPLAQSLLEEVQGFAARAPFRHLITPGGYRMSVAMTNCGSLGWVSDRSGYRYDDRDPASGEPWPEMPASFLRVAQDAALAAGFPDFVPDACLINRYVPRSRLTLHQDRNERGYASPIVSVSLGAPAVFLFGGLKRSDATVRVPLRNGDVVVWGGPARMRYHGVLALKAGERINLTFRKAG